METAQDRSVHCVCSQPHREALPNSDALVHAAWCGCVGLVRAQLLHFQLNSIADDVRPRAEALPSPQTNGAVPSRGCALDGNAQVAKQRERVLEAAVAACVRGHASVLHVLHNAVPDRDLFSSHNHNGLSPLMVAVSANHTHEVEVLLSHIGVRTDPRDDTDRTAFVQACAGDCLEIVQLFLRYDMDGCSPQIEEALQIACAHGHSNIVGCLLAHHPLPSHPPTQHTLMHSAIAMGHTAVVGVLCDCGVADTVMRECVVQARRLHKTDIVALLEDRLRV